MKSESSEKEPDIILFNGSLEELRSHPALDSDIRENIDYLLGTPTNQGSWRGTSTWYCSPLIQSPSVKRLKEDLRNHGLAGLVNMQMTSINGEHYDHDLYTGTPIVDKRNKIT